jgi:DNA-directed RNA polymerase specialized sigma24 family protein
MSSWKGLLEKCLENPWKSQKNFTMEVMEINDIAEKIFVRIDQKIRALKTVEAKADEKIAILDGLITRFTKMNNMVESSRVAEPIEPASDGRRKEVKSLFEKGFTAEQIARILDLPSGEVELILNLAHE